MNLKSIGFPGILAAIFYTFANIMFVHAFANTTVTNALFTLSAIPFITALLALGDVAHGEKVFKKCKACHSIMQGGGNKIGPKLWNIMFSPV